jgi:hypothetical protein
MTQVPVIGAGLAGLTQLLLDSVLAGSVVWGHRTRNVRTLEDGRHEVTFAGGSVIGTDILSGAAPAYAETTGIGLGVQRARADTVHSYAMSDQPPGWQRHRRAARGHRRGHPRLRSRALPGNVTTATAAAAYYPGFAPH